MASLFDAIKMDASRPLCSECGGCMGRGGEAPGLPAMAHDRYDQVAVVCYPDDDQAVVVRYPGDHRGNPCPGGGKPTVSSEEFYARQRREGWIV